MILGPATVSLSYKLSRCWSSYSWQPGSAAQKPLVPNRTVTAPRFFPQHLRGERSPTLVFALNFLAIVVSSLLTNFVYFSTKPYQLYIALGALVESSDNTMGK
jgi:hypothetical protein